MFPKQNTKPTAKPGKISFNSQPNFISTRMPKPYLIVDVGGTKILAAAVTARGEILARCKLKTNRAEKDAILSQLDDALDCACSDAKIARTAVAGIALGVPGVVDSQTGYIISTPNTPLTDTPLGERLSAQWDCPILVGNDVNIGMAGEFWRGAAQEASSAFGIFVGTGIGGGLILDGKLIEGFRGLAGEIGNLMLPLDADELLGMTSKKHLRLEELCSRTAIENQLRHAIVEEGQKSALTSIVGDKKLERIRSGALRKALEKEDDLVTDVVRRASYLLGFACASVIHVVDPQVIVFGGGVIEACGKWMMPWIEKTTEKVAMTGNGKPLQIVQSKLGDDAIIMGGLALLKDREPQTSLSSERIFASVDKPVRS